MLSALTLARKLISITNATSADPEPQERSPRKANMPDQNQLKVLRSFAKEAWKVEVSQRAETAEEWQHAVRVVLIASLKHTHDSVATSLGHGDATC